MNTGERLRALLAPLGVYRWEGAFQWGELQSEGEALDGVAEALAHIRREMQLTTAQEEGLTGLCELMACRPSAEDPEQLRLALAALLRIGNGSFTLAAMNDTLRGCGIPALVEETGNPFLLTVSFPETGGVPAEFSELKRILEGILPCQVQVQYKFQYMTWKVFEARFVDWNAVEKNAGTWESFEKQTL